jgi:endo-1,4-beta-xylanase
VRKTSLQTFALVSCLVAMACSGTSEKSGDNPSGGGSGPTPTGGTATDGDMSGGTATSSGGTSSTGGSTSGGGAVADGGTSSTGGTMSTGGIPSTGGTTGSGGRTATGGSPTTGGSESTGGIADTGGTSSTGGSPASGGTVSTGGIPNTGGTTGSDGSSSTAGSSTDGGASTGGASSTGGTSGSGGRSNVGGSTGSGGSTLVDECTEAGKTVTRGSGLWCGYTYENWVGSGSATMVLKMDGFSVNWTNNTQFVGRVGARPGSGDLVVQYSANFQPNGNSYLCVYGWTTDPLVEYYVVDGWGSWRPPGGSALGTVSSDGGTYDIYKSMRNNQPSIKGTATFPQYWSVRQQKKTSGTITIANHISAWASKGMEMGTFYELSMTVEGYQSSGSADVKFTIE